jgi:nickel-dependent lactate racemase
MVESGARAGRIIGNPVRAGIEQGAGLLGVDFILNVVTGAQNDILEAVAGEPTAAHRRGCGLVAARGSVRIPRPADIVLVSAGGYPKDLDLYQAQKALDQAAHGVRTGGIIILVAECREGLGNPTFERWMREASGPDDLLGRIQREFVLGGHKAAAIAAVQKRARILLISDLAEEAVRCCGMRPYPSITDALHEALREAGSTAAIAVLPQGGSVLPVVRQGGLEP